MMADIFGITTDELFGIKKETQDAEFEDSQKLYIVMYKGNKMLKKAQCGNGEDKY